MDKWIVGNNFAVRLSDIKLVRHYGGETEIMLKEGIYEKYNALKGTEEDIDDILKQIRNKEV